MPNSKNMLETQFKLGISHDNRYKGPSKTYVLVK